MRIWAFSVRRWQFTLVLFGLLIAVGVNSFLNIPRSEDPEFHVPIPTVVAVYPGADPVDIERLVVDPIEDALNELDDIKRMDSRSLDGVGVIQPEFHWHTDPDEKFDEVVREVNRIRDQLPADLASLEVRKTGSGLVNIVQVALVSEDASYRELQKLAEDLRDSIETVPGVRRSEYWAVPAPEVRVALDLERMGRAGVTLGQVEMAVRGENATIPGGAVDVGLRKYNLKTSGGYDSLDEVAETVVASRGGRIVKLRDVADVSWEAAEERYVGRFNGKRAVFVTASAKDRVNVFDVRDGIYQKLDQFERDLPQGVVLERGFDQSRNVSHRLNRLGMDFADRDRPRRADAAAARAARVGGRDDLDPAVARDRAVAALLHRVLAQPAVDRRLRAGARAAGGRFDRGRGEHLAVPARRLLAVRCGDRGHRPDRARGARLHRHAAVRLPAAAVPPGGRRQVHPVAAGRGALHGAGVAAGRAHGDPVPRQPHPASRGPRRRRQPGSEGADVGDPPDLFACAQGRAREPAPDTARGAGAAWPRPSRWYRSSA